MQRGLPADPVVRQNFQCSIDHGSGIPETAQQLIADRKLLQRIGITRVKF